MTRRTFCIWCIPFAILLLVYTAYTTQAQQPYIKKYAQNEGFVSTVVYSIVQDKQHFLWFSTENGVCRFDGRRMKHFTPANSDFDLGIFLLHCDMHNRVWAVSIFSPPAYYYNNRFYTLPVPLRTKVHNTRWILEDGKGYIYFLTREGNIVRWKGGNDYSSLHVAGIEFSGAAVINDTMLVVSGFGNILTVTNFKTVKKLPIQGYVHEPNRFYRAKENLVIGYASDGIYQYTPAGYKMIRKHTDLYSSISYSMHFENDSTIWLATRDGVHIFRYNNGHLHFIKKLFPGECILSIYKDHNGNYWFAATNEAIYFLNATRNMYYTIQARKTNIKYISFTGNTGHIFSNNGDHYLLSKDSLIYKGNIVANTPTYTYLKSIKISDSTILITYRGINITLLKNGKLSTPVDLPYFPASNYYYRNDGKFYSVINSGNKLVVWQVQDTRAHIAISIELDMSIDVSKQFCFDYSNRCWTSCADTLICIEPTSDGNGVVNRYPTHGIFISDIRCDADNNVWIATKGAGIYCINSNHTINSYTMEQGLVTNFCSSLYVDADNNIWACSQNGLNKIYNTRHENRTIKAFTKDNLLPVSVVNCVYKKDNMVYAGTTDGLFVFEDTDTGANTRPVNCYITGVSIAGKTIPVKNNYTLPYGKSINIGFSTIDYNQSAAPIFHYRLEGVDEQWSTTPTGQIQYGQLKPGRYTFSVYSGKSPLHRISISIHVLTPFWQQWWFILCIVIIFLLLAFAASYILVRVKHRKAELARRMLENDLKSLRAQINPHFIFNALNSIQDFILDQQPRIANHYLTRFARLMRMIVDNSKKEWISLSGEIYFLQLYLELEKLRMGDSFTFTIITDAGIDTELLHIPPMLIQPLVENSIKHGLAAKQGDKHLEIYFGLQKDMVYCRVKDNGMGREHAQTIASKNMPRQSMGIENISERLQLLSARQNTRKESVIITDLYDGATPAGTLVEMLIPYFIDN